MNQKIIIVIDCGATNVRAVAINKKGNIIAQKSYPNNTQHDPYFNGGLIWDVDKIWSKLVKATKQVLSLINKTEIIGITITSFGVDGAPMKKSGEMLYPVISWACQRTSPIMENIEKYISLEKLYEISGVNAFSFNTINKLIWFKENKAEILDQMDYFVFMPSLLLHKLSGEFVTDATMAGTSMMTDIKSRDFSKEILDAIGIENKFPPLVEAGEVVGKINQKASKETGIPTGIPVVVAGHDTQFAVFGSGAKENEVVLSSGTWEILMARTANIQTGKDLLDQGLTIEFDAIHGLYNPGLQWLGSGILEWIRHTFYTAESNKKNIYNLMIREAEKADTSNLSMEIDFLNENGILSGLGINTKREEIYRAALESLARKTKHSLEILEKAGGFTAESIIVVGGGSKNKLWNKLREKELGIPVKTIDQKETTVLGAAMVAIHGLGIGVETQNFVYLLFTGLIFFLLSCNMHVGNEFTSHLPNDISRTWIGPEYWANPLQDWQLKDGQIECVVSGGFRNVFLLTHEISSQDGDFSMSVNANNLNPNIDTLNEGWIGFEIGIRGEFDDYRNNAVRGRGFPLGITSNGRLFIGKIDTSQKPNANISLDNIIIEIEAIQQDDGDYIITVQTQNIASPQPLQNIITRKNIPANWIEGNIALMCHSGSLQEFPDEWILHEYPVWGTAKGTRRGGNINFGFSDWKISGDKISIHKERAFGPILFTQYTLSKGILKMTAQMPPIGNKDGQTVALQANSYGKWNTLAKANIDPISRTATFRIEDWDASNDTHYRLVYQLYVKGNMLKDCYFEGIIRKEPMDQEEVVVAGFTGNNDLGFPNNDIVESVKYHDPDLLFFSGDQIYEGVGGYGAQRSPPDKAIIDYLRKWYLYGWAYADLMRDRPTIAIPDDHDVYHGNIWGAGGIATPEGLSGGHAQDMGGYKMPAAWVNMVQRTQTGHLPDPVNPTTVAQDIGVYYTCLNYAGISFAIIEDRKFKSAPKPLLPEAEIYNGWAQNKTYDEVAYSDVEGAVLLGQRQLDFLENWSADWSGNTWMKVVLSQTIFANVATLPEPDSYSDGIVPRLRIMKKSEYPPDDVPVSDFDANSWPQTGRNNALKAIRKSFAFHIAGDQHLGSTIQYGIDDWHDAGYALCVPAISNVWPRRWCPAVGGQNRSENAPIYTGDFTDGFGNKMSVYAVSNPVYTGQKPANLYDRATGYGIVRFNKDTRDIIIECWPRLTKPEKDAQYPGWPLTINQEDNFGQNAELYLPEIKVEGMENPIIQVVNEADNEIIYTFRMKGNSYQPKVLKEGLYTLKVGDPDLKKEKILNHISPSQKTNDRLTIEF